jgi:hypothetical protein
MLDLTATATVLPHRTTTEIMPHSTAMQEQIKGIIIIETGMMSAHLSRLRLFQRHLRSLVWVWVWVWDWIHSHTPPRTRSPSSRHPPFTHYPFPLRSLVCGGQPSPHKPRLVVSHSTCPPLSSSPHAHSFVLGTAVINTHGMPHRTATKTVPQTETCNTETLLLKGPPSAIAQTTAYKQPSTNPSTTPSPFQSRQPPISPLTWNSPKKGLFHNGELNLL